MHIIEKRNMALLSNLAYDFLNMRCGSIAHYDRWGWIGTYPTVDHLAAFFERNEFGCPVINYLPSWAGDALAIVSEIDTMLAEYRAQRKIEIEAAAITAEERRKVRENVIIHVKGGVVVAVDNLPNLWTYTVDDADVKAVGEKVENCKT